MLCSTNIRQCLYCMQNVTITWKAGGPERRQCDGWHWPNYWGKKYEKQGALRPPRTVCIKTWILKKRYGGQFHLPLEWMKKLFWMCYICMCYTKQADETFQQCLFNSIVPLNLEMFSIHKECKQPVAQRVHYCPMQEARMFLLVLLMHEFTNWDCYYCTLSCQLYSGCTTWIMFFQTMQRALRKYR